MPCVKWNDSPDVRNDRPQVAERGYSSSHFMVLFIGCFCNCLMCCLMKMCTIWAVTGILLCWNNCTTCSVSKAEQI